MRANLLRTGEGLLAAAMLLAAASAARATDPTPATGLFGALAVSGRPAIAPEDDSEPARSVSFYLTLLHHNDGESQLINAGLGLEDFGGVARFKTLADLLKADALVYPPGPEEHGVIMVTSGDNFLAGPEFNASLALPPGQPYYDSLALSLIGYAACALGNHEFDFGPDVLERFIDDFTVPIPFVTANLDFSLEPGLQALVDAGRIAHSVIVTVGAQQVGIIGATTEDLPFISSPRNVIVNAVLPAVEAEINALVAANVNKIILIAHLQGLVNEFNLVSLLHDVDIVIGGGGGELLANPADVLVPGDVPWPVELGGTGYPRTALDLNGRAVPVVTTKGDYRYIGRLIIGFDAAGEIVSIDPSSGPVRVAGGSNPDAVPPDPLVQELVVDPVAEAVANLVNNVVGYTEVPLDGTSPNIRSIETNLGNLCADALLYNATVQAPQYGLPQPDVGIQNGGGIRLFNTLPIGNITEFDTFSILPFANFVCIVPDIPPEQFKEILENAVSRVGGSSTGRWAHLAGCRMVWDIEGTAQQLDANGNVTVPGTRVREVVLDDGRVIVADGAVAPGAPAVNIATLDFLATGGDQYPFRGAPFTRVGVTYQQSLLNLIQDYLGGLVSAQEYPVGGEGRIVRLPAQSLPQGVACGDVTQTTAVLWARPVKAGTLTFEWGTHPSFAVIEGSSVAAVTDPTVPARIPVAGLTPDTAYYFRVRYNASGASAGGRFRTAAALGTITGLRFGATGDWQQAPPYPSLQNVAARDLEFFLKLGDTIYADTPTPAQPGVVQARTLGQLRTKHAEVASERPQAPGFNAMRDLAASTALLATIDDHEIVDNFAGGALPGDSPDAPDVHPGEPPLFVDPVPFVNLTAAYQVALQAFREYHPLELRDWNLPGDARMDGRPRLYRYHTYGSDAAMILLDSRSFRDAQLPPVSDPLDPQAIGAFLFATFTPGRTLLGGAQLAQLESDLLAAEQAGVTWKFVTIPEPIQNFGPLNAEDRFEGYAAERSALLRFIRDQEIRNVVFLAGDFHGNLVNNLTYQDVPFGPQIATGAIEMVVGPAAFYNGLFGPAVVNLALGAGLITPAEKAFYDLLPVAPDADDVPNDKDDFVKALLVEQTTALGYDPIGLDDNLPQANGLFTASLLQGDYVVCHNYTWAELEIDAATQELLVTIWGIPPYSEADFLADPAGTIALQPQVVAQFELAPQP